MLTCHPALNRRQILLLTNQFWRQLVAAAQLSPISVRHEPKMATDARRPLAAALARALALIPATATPHRATPPAPAARPSK